MRSFTFVTILVLSVNYTKCVYDLKEYDRCSSDFTGDSGICVLASSCNEFKTQRNKLKICAFNGKIPLVCCPTTNVLKIGDISIKRISARKCDEYIQQTPPPDNVFTPTVVGGTKANINEFPHMSAIGWKRSNNMIDWMCGGSLISEKFVLSAAHCASLGRKRPDVVRIGDVDLNVNEIESNPQEVAIGNVIVHPEYKHPIKYHDLALFELSVPVIFSKGVHPACLYQSNEHPSTYLEVLGYGQISFGGPQSNILLKGHLNTVDNDQCNRSYEDDSLELPYGITQQQLCAWDSDGKRDTCQGDSGGPLQRQNYSERYIKYFQIIGVTSFGKFCAAGVPGVYIRVFSYLDWIESVVWPETV
ncbi:serine protease snake-like [Chironomus tepperi]|uniref:serine protease snake-like n=1 Tax=Chironomus tepperi TaxID=113505 RepID=UPI00391F80B0